MALFGSTYLMPFFLGLVREHNALEIGTIMLVSGVAQLVAAPVVVALEQRVDARWLTGFGFALFAAGLLASTRQTAETDFAGMLVPQILRGTAIMFCLLPPTRLALGRLDERLVAGRIQVVVPRVPGEVAGLLRRQRARGHEQHEVASVREGLVQADRERH